MKLNIGVFAYYPVSNSLYPKIKIAEIKFENNDYNLVNMHDINLPSLLGQDYWFNWEPKLNDL